MRIGASIVYLYLKILLYARMLHNLCSLFPPRCHRNRQQRYSKYIHINIGVIDIPCVYYSVLGYCTPSITWLLPHFITSHLIVQIYM